MCVTSIGNWLQYGHLCLISNCIFLLEICDGWNAGMFDIAHEIVCWWCFFGFLSRWILWLLLITLIFAWVILLFHLRETVAWCDRRLCDVCILSLYTLQRTWSWHGCWYGWWQKFLPVDPHLCLGWHRLIDLFLLFYHLDDRKHVVLWNDPGGIIEWLLLLLVRYFCMDC